MPSSQSDFRPEDAIEFWDVTNKQDWHVCELSQQGIASRAYQPGPYHRARVFPRPGYCDTSLSDDETHRAVRRGLTPRSS